MFMYPHESFMQLFPLNSLSKGTIIMHAIQCNTAEIIMTMSPYCPHQDTL